MRSVIEKVSKWLYGIKSDKLLHFIFGMIIAQVIYTVLSIGIDKWNSLLWAFVATAIIGGIKEIVDYTHSNGVASWKDFFSTLIGGATGVLVMMMV